MQPLRTPKSVLLNNTPPPPPPLTDIYDMPRKNKKSSGSQKPETQRPPPNNPSNRRPSQASASSRSGPSTDQPTQTAGGSKKPTTQHPPSNNPSNTRPSQANASSSGPSTPATDRPTQTAGGSKKPKTQPSSNNPSNKASASSPSRPSTTATDQPTQAAARPSDAVVYKGLLFPVDGSPPGEIDYITTKPTEGTDKWLKTAADFSPYWNGDYTTRKAHSIVFEAQSGELEGLYGHYVIYYSGNPDLPVNEALLKLPALRAAVGELVARGEKFEERMFWRGDVFVARLREPFENEWKAKYDDILPELMEPLVQMLAEGLAINWEQKSLESYAEYDVKYKEQLVFGRVLVMGLPTPPPEQPNPGVASHMIIIASHHIMRVSQSPLKERPLRTSQPILLNKTLPPTDSYDMPNKKKKKSSGSKKSKTQHQNLSNTQPSQASASSQSGPSTSATDRPTLAGNTSTKVTYKGLRFPADGSPPDRIDYTTTPASREDPWLDFAADFSPYWNGDYKTRKFQIYAVEKQDTAILNGYYIGYYSRNSDLPVNKTILSMPPMRAAVDWSIAQGEKFEERLFWRGDVFVCRMPFENGFEAMYDDISPQLVQPLSELLARVYVDDWEEKRLERFVRMDAEWDEHDRKQGIVKEKLATEMGLTPDARENPEIKNLLDVFAIMCTVGNRQDDQGQEMG
ncbi:hypothetical protein K440DRAFT_662006 [Wilcoxina mikolae CBS 423.85]|nr:hypothetical protein K440DRAFT_662006 [Wilcoxina mikolae CBS 423.85]